MNRGYLYLAFGDYYVEELISLVHMIRKTGDTLPISVVCGINDFNTLQSTNLFHKIIVHHFDHKLYVEDCLTGFEKYCLIPRLLLNTFLVYDETIITDTDMLCQYNPSHIWDIMSKLDQPVVMTGQKYSPDWHFGYNHLVSKQLGKNVPESHGGIFYINKNHKDLDMFFEKSIEVYKNYDSYGLKRFFRNGRVDEPIFAIVNALFDYKVMEFGEEPIITFNYDDSIELPSKLQTFGKYKNPNAKELKNYIPFIHMFKPHRHDYFKLVDKILKK